MMGAGHVYRLSTDGGHSRLPSLEDVFVFLLATRFFVVKTPVRSGRQPASGARAHTLRGVDGPGGGTVDGPGGGTTTTQ